MKIYSTNNYDMFKTVAGNREVIKSHVRKLAESLQSNNLMGFLPIIVNENHEVIDGQHRLEAAKIAGVPVQYVIAEGTDLEDVQLLNSNSKAWSSRDYLESYCKLGNQQYQLLKLFVDTYHLPVGISLNMLTDETGHGAMDKFRAGKIKVTHLKQGELIANEYTRLRKYCVSKADLDKNFISAVIYLCKKTPGFLGELITKMERFGKKIERRTSTKDYLREFEDILNFHQIKVLYRLT